MNQQKIILAVPIVGETKSELCSNFSAVTSDRRAAFTDFIDESDDSMKMFKGMRRR